MAYNETPYERYVMYNEKIIKVEKHIKRNRAKYAALTTLVVCVTVQRQAAKQWNAFLTDEGLFNKFYQEED